MKKIRCFTKRSRIPAPVELVFGWHTRPGALERLSPPWDPIKVIERKGGIEKGAQVVLQMKAGPIPYLWKAQHIDYVENQMFRDRQIHGPFASWTHTHLFESDGPNACFLEDQIEFSLPFHPLGNFFGATFVHQKLEAIFQYRHTTLKNDLRQHQSIAQHRKKTILISGASGVIGSALIPFLTTGGHQVIRLVRKKSNHPHDIFWEPENHVLHSKDIAGIDAVIHLAGENIGVGRWTEEKKKRILNSRIHGTRLLAKTISEMETPPEVLICASAIGYYGNRGDQVLTEEDAPGTDFISEVCQKWEQAAMPAVDKGIRVVFLRIGVVLTPMGGALQRLLLPFQMGIGGKLGNGKQYVSWVDIDDVIGAIYYSMFTQVSGPINVTAPHPVTNAEFTEILGSVLCRPTALTVPAWAIRLAFGQMGNEVPLSSTRAVPNRLIKHGYSFLYPTLENSLNHLLGKAKD